MQESGSQSWRHASELRRRRRQLAKLIRERRIEVGLSPGQAATLVGVSRWTWIRWEDVQQPRSVASDLLPALARTLQVSVTEIVDAVIRDPRRAVIAPREAAA